MGREWTPFASAVTDTRVIPGSDGKTIVIRRVGYTGMKKARQVAQIQAMSILQSLEGVVDKLGGIEGIQAAAKKEADAGQEADPLATHDALTLIAHGVVTWPDGLTPNAEALDLLDPGFVDWLAREIWALSKPESPGDRGNASGASTTP